MSLQLDVLDKPLLAEPGPGVGTPLQLAIDTIDEDPEQPRHEFDAEKLQELADTVLQRGVREPISVRPHPTEAGRWMVNSGARRLRAARLARKTHIPAFVDITADSYDQVIENEQRESLTALELSMFVQRRMRLGETQGEIARRLGKSQSYVAFACSLIDAPDWLMNLYRQGRCRGLTELYQLRRLHAGSPSRVEAWSDGRGAISRVDVQRLREELEARTDESRCAEEIISPPMRAELTTAPQVAAPVKRTRSSPQRRGEERPVLLAHSNGAVVEVILEEVPEAEGHVFVLRGDGRMCVPAADVQLLGFCRRQDLPARASISN